MTPRDRAEKIVERFLSTPEGFAPDDKQALIAAIEQGMNEVLEDAATKVDLEADHWKRGKAWNYFEYMGTANTVCSSLRKATCRIRALKSPDTPRNTITDNQKDEEQ